MSASQGRRPDLGTTPSSAARRVQSQDPEGSETVRVSSAHEASIEGLDDAHTALVRVAAAVAAAREPTLRAVLSDAVHAAPHDWVEEVILQSYLFAGFPRTLNAARAWRRLSGRAAPLEDPGERWTDAEQWSLDGARTCAVVYGASYERLRQNIRALHPALDAWMIVDGYGKVLSRPGLDLRQRELCIVAACAAAGQDRQLHSHLRGALNAGASAREVGAVLDAVTDLMAPGDAERYRLLLDRVVQRDVH